MKSSRIDLKVMYLFIQFLLNPFANVKWIVKIRKIDKFEQIINTSKSMTNLR